MSHTNSDVNVIKTEDTEAKVKDEIYGVEISTGKLDMSDIYGFFDSPSVNVIVNCPPSGSLIHYSWSSDLQREDWKVDGYRWRYCGSAKNRKIGSGLCDRLYFQVYDGPKSWSKLFTKMVYSRKDHPNSVVIQYNGDETVAASFPHGNARKTTRNYTRTQPSVLRAIQSISTESRMEFFRLMVTAASNVPNQDITAPINIEQVRKIKKTHRNETRPSRDALFNLHEFAMNSEFVQLIATFPNLEVILYHPEVVDIFKSTLSIEVPSTKPTQILSYDTTFNIGDFFVSILLFRATAFNKNQVIPLAYFIHEQNFMASHESFFQHMKKIIPQLDQSTNTIIVTDQEKAIIEPATNIFPNLKLFICWNHIIQNAMRWLKSHGNSTAKEAANYSDNIRHLLQSSTEDEYKDRLILKLRKWSKSLSDYFMETVHPSINHVAAWELNRFGLDQVTTNQLESLNFILKKLQDWKKVPVDSICLSLFRLCEFDMAELRREYVGLGSYTPQIGIHQEQATLSTAIDYTTIVDKIRTGNVPSVAYKSLENGPHFEQPFEVNEPSTSIALQLEDPSNLTIQERALGIINTNKLSLNHQLAVFTVMGTKEVHVVRLFPSTTCSCSAKSLCHHIVAARMAIGITDMVAKRPTMHLSQLQRCKRKRADKTSERKQPRFLDADVLGELYTDVSPVPPPVETGDDKETVNVPVYNNGDNCNTFSSTEPPPINGTKSEDID